MALFPFLIKSTSHKNYKFNHHPFHFSPFGKLFEVAAKKVGIEIGYHGFDSAVVEVSKESLSTFIDSLLITYSDVHED